MLNFGLVETGLLRGISHRFTSNLSKVWEIEEKLKVRDTPDGVRTIKLLAKFTDNTNNNVIIF